MKRRNSGELTGNYYNPKTGAFYSRENKTGHVVGWDDNYPRENFNSNFRPAANGAWIAKDNKGEKHGNQGYIWISYEDTSVRLKNFTFLNWSGREIISIITTMTGLQAAAAQDSAIRKGLPWQIFLQQRPGTGRLLPVK